jgi:hypothetical protein
VLRPAITSLEPIRSLTHPKAYFAITRGGTRTEITTKQNNGTGEKKHSAVEKTKVRAGRSAREWVALGIRTVY